MEFYTDNLKESIRGVTQEINRRTWAMNELVIRYTGSEKRFITPVKNKLPVVDEALRLRRETDKLRRIKSELRHILNQQPL